MSALINVKDFNGGTFWMGFCCTPQLSLGCLNLFIAGILMPQIKLDVLERREVAHAAVNLTTRDRPRRDPEPKALNLGIAPGGKRHGGIRNPMNMQLLADGNASALITNVPITRPARSRRNPRAGNIPMI